MRTQKVQVFNPMTQEQDRESNYKNPNRERQSKLKQKIETEQRRCRGHHASQKNEDRIRRKSIEEPRTLPASWTRPDSGDKPKSLSRKAVWTLSLTSRRKWAESETDLACEPNETRVERSTNGNRAVKQGPQKKSRESLAAQKHEDKIDKENRPAAKSALWRKSWRSGAPGTNENAGADSRLCSQARATTGSEKTQNEDMTS
jgi:hypothetical protein